MKRTNIIEVLSLIAESVQHEDITINGIQISNLRREFYQHSIVCDLSGSAFESVAYEYPSFVRVSKTQVSIRKEHISMVYHMITDRQKMEEREEIENIIRKILR